MKKIAKFLVGDHDKRIIIQPTGQPELKNWNDFEDMNMVDNDLSDVKYEIDDIAKGG